MADTVSKEKRSWIMSKVKSRNTKLEIAVRSLLHGMGYRFRLKTERIAGSPDLVLRRHGTLVFVNGCFWHGHDNCKKANIPKTNTAFWRDKIERNKKRDSVNYRWLKREGWKLLIIWECEFKDIDKLKERIRIFFDNTRTRN